MCYTLIYWQLYFNSLCSFDQVSVRIGSPVTGYGQDSRNRAARQRIPHRIWTDEDGVEHVEASFVELLERHCNKHLVFVTWS